MEVMQKKGFKQTEVGMIPEDWEVFGLSHVLNGIADVDHYMPKTEKHGIPYVMTGDLKELVGDIDFDNCKKISTTAYKKLTKKVKNVKGDIILARYATVGTVSFVNIDFDFIVSYSCVTIKPDTSKLVGLFLYYYFKSSIFKSEVENKVNANIQDNVGIGDLVKMKIPLPPTLAEQAAIATALSDVDGLIANLDQLITKKKAMKQGAMQQLLTGKTRVKGFEGSGAFKQTEVGLIPVEWSLMSIGAITNKIVGGGTPSRSNTNFWNGNVPWVTVKDFSKFNRFSAQETITALGLKGSASNLIPKGVLITSTRMALGKAFIYEVDVAINQDLKALFLLNNYDTLFLFYWFQLNSIKIEEVGSGSTVMGISLNDLRKFPIALPPTLSEQKAIAQILSDMDAEINQLETKKAKYQGVKQGMMQELLTGKTRLV